MSTITAKAVSWRVWWTEYETPDTIYYTDQIGIVGGAQAIKTAKEADEIMRVIKSDPRVDETWTSFERV